MFKKFYSSSSFLLVFIVIIFSGKIKSIQNSEKPIIVITIPKCGTHLVARTISLLTGRQYYDIRSCKLLKDKNSAVYNFILAHAAYSKNLENILREKDYTQFFVIRDPRDQVISLAFYMQTMSPEWMHYIHPQFKVPLTDIDFKALVLDLIVDGSWHHKRTNIANYYSRFLPWLKVKDIYTIKFEDIVGPQGEGDKAAQLKVIGEIAKRLTISKTDQELEHISTLLFGRSTFREGKIGSWKRYFTETHKQAFKKVAGKLLISLGYEKDYSW